LGFGTGSSANTLTVLAGSELRDIEPLLPEIERATGYRLELRYVGTLNGAEQLQAGEQVDLAWFSHGKYISLLEGTRVRAQERIMLSPVVMGVKESKAREFGWIDTPLTWRDIAAKAESGELRFAMTNPTASNSGFTALVGVAAAFADTGNALTIADIQTEALQGFFKGQTLTAGSSGWLAESYVRDQDTLDGMINYESVLLSLNKGNQLRDKLVLIYPTDGIITADYPLMLINEDKREAYNAVVAFLRTPDMQEKLMTQTLRRPAVPGVRLSNEFPTNVLVELPFPNSKEVIDALLFSYLNEQRVPATAIFVLDVSGSMAGDRIQQLRTSLENLTGADTSLTGQFATFRNRERLVFLSFAETIKDRRDFEITDTAAQDGTLDEIREYIRSLDADGGTAIFGSLVEAYTIAQEAQAADPDRYYSIVLMSDGENTEGIDQRDFVRFYEQLPADARNIHTFTILFGNADEGELESIAELTGGRLFDASSSTSLASIFKEIRGYQ